ncbi:hypothetical protein [Methanobrevibacter sp.]|uniref:hypothetical protein n=1 Tax=Methanobrevibacter sp. TaxID=66852 RepID=UPI0038640C2F
MLWDKNKTNKNKVKTFNVRLNSDLQEKIEFLQERKGLNKSNIIRLAICDLYNTEIAKLK